MLILYWFLFVNSRIFPVLYQLYRFSSNIFYTFWHHMNMGFCRPQMGIYSRTLTLLPVLCVVMRRWWCVCVPEYRQPLSSNLATRENWPTLKRVSQNTIKRVLTSQEWLIKRAALPRIVASTTKLSSILNM